MCRHESPSDSNPRPIQIMDDGTYSVWSQWGWTPIESRLAQDLAARHRAAFHTYDWATQQLLRKALAKYALPTPKVVVNIPKPLPPPTPKPVQPKVVQHVKEPFQLISTPVVKRPEAPPSRHALPSYWFAQHDQGDVGTCHAFALAPLVDAFENGNNSNSLFAYHVSENWLVFLSVLDRLCSPKDVAVETGAGYFSERTLNRMLSIGYCRGGNYSDYKPSELIWKERETQKKDAGPLVTQHPPLAPQMEFFRDLLNNETQMQAFVEETKRSASFQAVERAFIPTAEEDQFKKAFKISSKFAIERFCKIDLKSDAEDLLKGTDATTEFRKCLTESLANRKKLHDQHCGVVSYGGQTNSEKMQTLKRSLLDGTPMVASVTNYGGWKDGGSHALAITGYDDEAPTDNGKGLFHVQNSWGRNRNIPVEYSKMDDVNTLTHLSCRNRPEAPKNQFAQTGQR